MQRIRTTLIAIAVASLLASITATLLGRPDLGTWLGVPALALAAWTFLGHFVTLDDDFPGGWSNEEGSWAVAARSVLSLTAKGMMLGIVGFVVLALPSP